MTILFTTLGAGIVSFMILDYTWLAIIAKNFYLSRLSSHITVTNGSLVPYLPAVPLVYLVGVVGIFVFVLGKVTTLTEAALYGALFGFILYAFYDFTNIATLKDYPWSLTLVDILWGTIAMSVVSTCMFFVKQLLS